MTTPTTAKLAPGTRAWIVAPPIDEAEVDLRGVEIEILGPGGMVGEYSVAFVTIDDVRQRWIDHPISGCGFDAETMGLSDADFADGRLGFEYDRDAIEPEGGPNTAPCLACGRRIPFGNVDDEGRCDRCQG